MTFTSNPPGNNDPHDEKQVRGQIHWLIKIIVDFGKLLIQISQNCAGSFFFNFRMFLQ